jgi:thiol:disulfide interchange protein DsbD
VEALGQALNDWGFALSQKLQGQLVAGSATAVFVVFAAGVLTSLTPCVYPMIPVTVTFIGGAAGGNRRRAVALSVTYVAALAVMYAGLGVVAALLGKIFGDFTRNPWVYAGVGLLIGTFGLAMLGVITIPLLATGLQGQGARRGGFAGAALMGVAAGFVTAPCTAPVLGVLLTFVGQTRNVVWGGTLLFVFALGLGLLLMLLGIFSGLLTSLPKAGVWMERVKKGFGVAMILIAAVFLWTAIGMWRHHGGGA